MPERLPGLAPEAIRSRGGGETLRRLGGQAARVSFAVRMHLSPRLREETLDILMTGLVNALDRFSNATPEQPGSNSTSTYTPPKDSSNPHVTVTYDREKSRYDVVTRRGDDDPRTVRLREIAVIPGFEECHAAVIEGRGFERLFTDYPMEEWPALFGDTASALHIAADGMETGDTMCVYFQPVPVANQASESSPN